ncbi:S-adenosylmethionine:tRNA ribosyltransferase-isomerase [Pseudobdellovibrio exovorus]|uniref:S-adenosylmethionine:tRNA ribosyltransferase-isomerase n=1 Tax=Pseudobdellovibrio exovorus JSS TaxID=1184267 RepID=M4VAY9_9BACT|nr:S-adenosylmethionine:tRNA ribosyltransferase-isomerase [Pseudobdellovibrio exovorus]AGH95640.1 S-adenosylmethionine:tRNA ribosyltransferase-isomerase [Pseudobdellovibrio exovorus JSS]
MKLADLQFDFPEELIATSPVRPTRVMWVEPSQVPVEITIPELLQKIPAGDVLVVNNTKVLKRRVFSEENIEILFLDRVEQKANSNLWKVLFPSKKYKIGDELKLPQGFTMKLVEKGRPQIVEVFPAISDLDFATIAELPLPPYIQKARQERHNVEADESWYQTAWASQAGSMAAPTASLHFNRQDLQSLASRGVHVIELTLHVGLGTFLPVTAEDLSQHQMHSEQYEISEDSWLKIQKAKQESSKVWALGTTTTRVLESVSRTGVLAGSTDILLQEGSEFQIVDRLLTNFHQPESTLLALVAGFSSLDRVKESYKWAIQHKFRLFSYGDLSVWLK